MTPLTIVKETEEKFCGVVYKELPIEKQKIVDRIKELKKQLSEIKGSECEVYSRIVGYFQMTKNWNKGKSEEWVDRKVFESFDGKDLKGGI